MLMNFSKAVFLLLGLSLIQSVLISQRVIVENDLKIEGATKSNSLSVEDSTANPFVKFNVDGVANYTFLLNKFSNELLLLGPNGEDYLSIKEGEVYIPKLAGNYERPVFTDTAGLLLVNDFSTTINFSQTLKEEVSDLYKTNYYGYRLPNGLIVNQLKVRVGDWDPEIGNFENSVVVELRRAPIHMVGSAETIFKIETTTQTPDLNFEELTTTEVLTPGANYIDNDNYIYYLLIFSCPDCAFRTATLN